MPEPSPLRALVVDDEPLARGTLRALIAEVPWLRVVGEAADGLEAVRLLNALTPDLVFLDIQMPELSGLDVLERAAHMPAVVFTTAYDTYAVAAFELGALDYLLKPFGRARFLATLERVQRTLARPGEAPPLLDRARWALGGGASEATPLTRLFVHHRDRIVPLRVEHVVRFEAQDDYVAVYAGRAPMLLHVPLGVLEKRLDPQRFFRIHRSHLVNLDHVRALLPYDATRLLVELDDGSRLVASRSGSRSLRRLVV